MQPSIGGLSWISGYAFYHHRFDGTDEHSHPIPGVRIMRAVTGNELGDMTAVHKEGKE